jgi:hypothetical protein
VSPPSSNLEMRSVRCGLVELAVEVVEQLCNGASVVVGRTSYERKTRTAHARDGIDAAVALAAAFRPRYLRHGAGVADGSVGGSRKCGKTAVSANQVSIAIASPSSVSTSRPYGRAIGACASGR